MLIESLSDAGLAPSSPRTSTERRDVDISEEIPEKKATRSVMILYQVPGLVGSIVNQITRVFPLKCWSF